MERPDYVVGVPIQEEGVQYIHELETRLDERTRRNEDLEQQVERLQRSNGEIAAQRQQAVENMEKIRTQAQTALSNAKTMGQNAIKWLAWMMLTLGKETVELDRKLGASTAQYELKADRHDDGSYTMTLKEKDELGQADRPQGR